MRPARVTNARFPSPFSDAMIARLNKHDYLRHGTSAACQETFRTIFPSPRQKFTFRWCFSFRRKFEPWLGLEGRWTAALSTFQKYLSLFSFLVARVARISAVPRGARPACAKYSSCGRFVDVCARKFGPEVKFVWIMHFCEAVEREFGAEIGENLINLGSWGQVWVDFCEKFDYFVEKWRKMLFLRLICWKWKKSRQVLWDRSRDRFKFTYVLVVLVR